MWVANYLDPNIVPRDRLYPGTSRWSNYDVYTNGVLVQLWGLAPGGSRPGFESSL